jgi:transcriptional regulator with XRE-family HTH domain
MSMVVVEGQAVAAGGGDAMAVLAAHRKRLNLTQRDVAERLGVTQPAVAALERPNAAPTLATMQRYAEAVGVAFNITIDSNPAVGGAGRVAALPLVPRVPSVAVDMTMVAQAIEGYGPNRDLALYEASQMTGPHAVAGMLLVEHLSLKFTKVKTLFDGVSTDGDALTVWRCVELCDQYKAAVDRARALTEPSLVIATPRGVLSHPDRTPNGPDLSVVETALRWVSQALVLGAGENQTWLTANSYLLWHGHPWLMAHHDVQYHDDMLAKLIATKDATDYLATYLVGLQVRESWWRLD